MISIIDSIEYASTLLYLDDLRLRIRANGVRLVTKHDLKQDCTDLIRERRLLKECERLCVIDLEKFDD